MFITSFGEQNITYKCCSNFLIHLFTILFKNIGFNHSIKNLQEEIINKEKTLRSMHDESELIKADFSKLHKESTENLKILNNEKLEYTNKINALGLELNEIHQDRITLLNKIQSFETQNRINTEPYRVCRRLFYLS
ncbi:hypothetical protein GPS64_17745 [Acinetobacter haemolyticus]|nr:hypothetical protein [Acinetobacter haemolyticus]